MTTLYFIRMRSIVHLSKPDLSVSRPVLIAALTIDLLLIGLWLSQAHPVVDRLLDPVATLVSITADGGLGELANYAKWALACVVLLMAARRRASIGAVAVACVFALLLADDSQQIHETAGAAIGRAAGFSYAAGELVVWAAMGLAAAALLLAALRADDGPDPAWLLGLVVLIVALGGFGVAVDALHSAALALRPDAWALDRALGGLEDGGEMVVASVMLAHVVARFGAPAERRARPET